MVIIPVLLREQDLSADQRLVCRKKGDGIPPAGFPPGKAVYTIPCWNQRGTFRFGREKENVCPFIQHQCRDQITAVPAIIGDVAGKGILSHNPFLKYQRLCRRKQRRKSRKISRFQRQSGIFSVRIVTGGSRCKRFRRQVFFYSICHLPLSHQPDPCGCQQCASDDQIQLSDQHTYCFVHRFLPPLWKRSAVLREKIPPFSWLGERGNHRYTG